MKLEVPLGRNLAYATGEITDAVAYQGFSFLIFTFYYTVIGIHINYLILMYILWSIYNAFNDPIIGGLSDKTRTKKFGGGRRRPWMVAMWIPLMLIMFFLFTPFATYAEAPVWTVIYFFLIICLFDTIYTAFSLSRTSLYPEMFRTDRAREEAGMGRRVMMVFGLIIAMVVPTLIIENLTESSQANIYNYWIAGAVLGIIAFITAFINIKWGVKEPPIEELETKDTMGVFKSIWYSIKNWKFVVFALCSTMNWYVFGLLPLIIPIYTQFALGKEDSIYASGLLLIAFLSSAPGVVLWMFVDRKIGSKRGFILSQAFWIASLIPLFFISKYTNAAIMFVLNGIALGGSPYFIDRNISNIVDEDELRTGQRREGSYYGVHALFVRMSSILGIISVGLILSKYGWTFFNPENVTGDLVAGLRSLVSIFPAVALAIGIVFLLFFPINKKTIAEIHAKTKPKNL
jgi:GPH family glycoside/pentoside/hexuronide:cation symporter